jgi:hypothetical protein
VTLSCPLFAPVPQTGDAAGCQQLLQSALKHWQSEVSARPRDPAAAAGVSWCLQRLVALKVAEVGWERRLKGFGRECFVLHCCKRVQRAESWVFWGGGGC